MTTRRRSRVRSAAASAAAVVLLAVLGACTATTRASAPVPRATPVPSPSPAASATPAPNCGDPKASLRPQGTLPPPGGMPAGTFMRTIQDRGRLVAGVSQDTLLFGSVNPFTSPPQFQGFDIDVLREMAKAILGDPDKIEFRAITSAERIPKILDGSVDIVGRTMTINCARRQQVEFSTVYYGAGQRVLVRRDSKAAGIQDLGGKKVCATKGSTSLDNIGKQASKPVPVGMADFTDCLVAFQAGEVDAISTDDAILAGLAAQDPYAVPVGAPFTEEPYGLAIRPDHPEFVRFVNAVLDRMRADGTWKAIYNTWLTRLGPAPEPPKAAYRD